MCGPLAGAAIGLAGSVVQGIGAAHQLENAAKQDELAAENQAKQYRRQGRFQARDILRQTRAQAQSYMDQAAIHKRQAELERLKGSYDAARMEDRAKVVLGGQIAGFAASGVQVSGTIADVVEKTGESAALDIAASRLSTMIAVKNENILKKINKENARRVLVYGKDAAADAIRFGEQSAKDVLKMGVTAAASARSAAPLALISPVIQGLGGFASSSGIFNTAAPATSGIY